MAIDFKNLSGEDKTAFDALVAAAIEGAISPLKTKNAELLDEKKKESEKRRELEGKLDGLDIDKAKELLAAMEENEDLKLVKEGKLDEVVQRRVKIIVDGKDKEIKTLQSKVDEAAKGTQTFSQKWRSERLTNTVHKLAAKFKVRAEAYDDLVSRTGNAFEVGDDGEIVLKKGVNLLTKEAKPHTLESWIESLPESAPHFFEGSSGGGARGGEGGGGSKNTIAAGDTKAFGKNLESIAKGETTLR